MSAQAGGNPFQYSRYTVDIDSTDFRYGKGTLDNYFFSTSDNPVYDNDAPFFMIRQLPNISSDYDSLKIINANLIKFEKQTFEFENIDSVKFDTLKLNGYNTIEMYGFAIVGNKKILIYNFVTGKKGNVIAMNAYIPKEHKKYLTQVQKISKSILFK